MVLFFVLPFLVSQMNKAIGLDDQMLKNKSVKKPINRMEKEATLKNEPDQKLITFVKKGIPSPQTALKAKKSERELSEIITKVESPTMGSEERPAGNVSLAKEKDYRALLGLESQTSEGEFRAVFLAEQPIKRYESFFIDSPPRLVIDLPGKWKNIGYSELKLKGDVVKSIRVGEHTDKLRLVMNLRDQGKMAPVIKESSRGLELVIR